MHEVLRTMVCISTFSYCICNMPRSSIKVCQPMYSLFFPVSFHFFFPIRDCLWHALWCYIMAVLNFSYLSTLSYVLSTLFCIKLYCYSLDQHHSPLHRLSIPYFKLFLALLTYPPTSSKLAQLSLSLKSKGSKKTTWEQTHDSSWSSFSSWGKSRSSRFL